MDGVNGKVYWGVGGELWQADLDGSNKQVILEADANIHAIAVDLTNDRVYFGVFSGGAGEAGTVWSADFDGSDMQVIIEPVWNGPLGVGLDAAAGKIYYSRNGPELNQGRVHRANLDGSEVETIALGVDAEAVALDLDTGRVYWNTFDADTYPDTSTIQRANLDGTDLETLPIEGIIVRGVAILSSVSIPCPGDLDGDNDVDIADLAQLLGHYGITEGAAYEDGDLDGDGDVDISDLAELLGLYGTVCE